MAAQKRKLIGHTLDTQASALKHFGSFRPESEMPTRKTELFEAAGLKRVLEAWQSLPKQVMGRASNRYEEILKFLDGVHASPDEVRQFLEFLEVTMPIECNPANIEKSGLFISALVDAGSADAYSLDIGNLVLSHIGTLNCKQLSVHGVSLEHVGHLNSGHLEIFGNVHYAATMQTSGETIIHGNCEIAGSYLIGGKLLVHGNSCSVGERMDGGRIDILGRMVEINPFYPPESTRLFVGKAMTGGEIHIASCDMGRTEFRSSGGRIYVGGKLAYKDGKPVRKRKRTEGG